MLLATLMLASALMTQAPASSSSSSSAAPAPLFSTMLQAGCTRIRFDTGVDTCVVRERRHDDAFGGVLAVEVFVADADTKRARRLDGFVVPTKYDKATSEIVTVDGRDQMLSIHFEGGTGTGYLEMMWLLVDLDDAGTALVARAFEPSSGHLGSLHTQSFTTTMKWNARRGDLHQIHVWKLQLGTSETTTHGSGTVTWVDELRCSTTCANADIEARIADDEAMFLPRRRLARARLWFESGAFTLHDPRTWQVTSLLVDQ